jgi:hypothetical protein
VRPSACNRGELGGGCETDEVCDRPSICAVLVDLEFVGPLRTCSECEADDECGRGEHCAPRFDFPNFGGFHECVVPQSRGLGEGCTLGPSGDAVCSTGRCVPTTLGVYGTAGSCGECLTDEDCGGAPCSGAYVDDATLEVIPSSCGQ